MITPIHALSLNDKLSLQQLKLKFLESAILKMYILNYSEDEIHNLLEIGSHKYHLIVSGLFFKYNSIDLFQTSLLAVSFGQIDRYDLVKDEIKKLALAYSGYIYDYFETSDFIEIKESSIIDVLLNEFIVKSNTVFINNKDVDRVTKLTAEEINFCKLKIYSHKGINSKQTNHLVRANSNIERALIDKLKVHNFFNAIRLIFELQLVDRNLFFNNYDGFSKLIKREVKDKIMSATAITGISPKEKRLFVYFDLIHYYNMMENKLLGIHS